MVDILHRVGITSTPDKVYDAITTIEGLAGWWTEDTRGTTDVGGVIGFRFGAGSFAAHHAEARAAGVEPAILDRPGLAFDLDTPQDLARWLELGSAA